MCELDGVKFTLCQLKIPPQRSRDLLLRLFTYKHREGNGGVNGSSIKIAF